MARLAVRNAVVVPLHAGGEPPFAGHLIVADDGTVEAIGPGEPPAGAAPQILDAEGRWLLPGFVSAHSHLWQSRFAGIAANCNVDAWSDELYALAAGLTPDDMFDLTLRGARAHLRNGITTAFNFTFTGADRTGLIDRAQFEGARQSGLRFVHGLNIGGVGPTWSLVQAEARADRFLAWAEPARAARRYLGTMIAGRGIYMDEPGQVNAEAALMHSAGLCNHQHYLESPDCRDAERARYAWMKAAGAIGEKMIFGHFIHTTPELLADAAAAGVRMSWNPLSNGRLGSGTPDIPAYRALGIGIGLGVDGEASADRADPFENMRMGLYQIRASHQRADILSAQEVAHMHTLGAAQALGIAEHVGSLEPGKLADFILFDPGDNHRDRDPVASLTLAGGVENISVVFVGGERVWDRSSPVDECQPRFADEIPWSFPADASA